MSSGNAGALRLGYPYLGTSLLGAPVGLQSHLFIILVSGLSA